MILGVTGSPLTYRAINIARYLVSQKADVHVLMTEEATKYINPIMFESITHNKCFVNVSDEDYSLENDGNILSKSADLIIIAPTSANAISKLSRGMADDMLTKTVLASNCVKLVAPALSLNVQKNPIVQDNIDILIAYGFDVINPKLLDINGNNSDYYKMASDEEIFDHIERCIAYKKDLIGKKVLVTAGPTCETIDPLKCITTMSTGKTGYEIAKACMLRGADVTLITGKTGLHKPSFVKIIDVVSAKDMFMAVNNNFANQDIIIKTAGVVDYAPSRTNLQKISSDEDVINLKLRKNPDILEYIGERKKKNQFICGMSHETQNILEKAREKLKRKNLDMIITSNLKSTGAEFTNDMNVATIITKDVEVKLNKMSKREIAHKVIDQILLEISL